ncbi:MAG: hypothetical protein ACR2IT_09200 [Pirellulales bacterium]
MPAFAGQSRIALCGIAILVPTVVAVVSGVQPQVCLGQGTADEQDPTGGLRTKLTPQARDTGTTREELVRQWDLDRNGTIDPSEAAIARERMRRGRKEMQFGSGIDPITGRPRDEQESEATRDDEATSPNPLDLLPEPVKRTTTEPSLPGTRVPDAPAVSPGAKPGSAPTATAPAMPRSSAAVPGSTGPGSSEPGSTGSGSTTPRSSATDRTRRQSGSASPGRPGTVTGGVRAGAPAARSGYGSLTPRSDLNAGRPRGGFLPSLRPSQSLRPGSGIPPAGQAVPTAPGVPTVRPPRVTADEIGGF